MMSMTHSLGLVLLGAVVAAGSAGTAQEGGRGKPGKALVEAGLKVYEREKCVTCHQIDGRGNSRFPLDGVGTKLKADDLRRWITDTVRMEDALPRMPAIRMSARRYRLSPGDLDALVAYLQTLK
jgi:mono/diheme cytochrome c family protein